LPADANDWGYLLSDPPKAKARAHPLVRIELQPIPRPADPSLHIGLADCRARGRASESEERYRQLLRQEITQTLLDPAHVEDEIPALFEAFRP
jgi:hypothetical protein